MNGCSSANNMSYGGSPGLVVMGDTHVQEVAGSNPVAIY